MVGPTEIGAGLSQCPIWGMDAQLQPRGRPQDDGSPAADSTRGCFKRFSTDFHSTWHGAPVGLAAGVPVQEIWSAMRQLTTKAFSANRPFPFGPRSSSDSIEPSLMTGPFEARSVDDSGPAPQAGRGFKARYVFALVLGVATASCGTAAVCDARTCATGCCNALGQCVPTSNQACGRARAACTQCFIGQSCNLGRCESILIPGSTGGGAVGGGMALGVAGGTAGGLAGGTAGGLAGGMAGGLAGGMAGGLAGGMAGGLAGGMAGGLAGGMAGGLAGGTAGGGTAQVMRVDVTAPITVNTTWTKAKEYVLKSIIHVDGAVLTIQPGTKVLGELGSALIVTGSGQLIAEGTATEPIVFTANYPVGMRGVGNNNWGGILMNGKAAINVPGGDNKAEGLVDEPRNRYGGGATPDNAHSCGRLKYVRIEFAGQPLFANEELNGLSLNACGTGTVVDSVQVHRSVDDGIEIFGGSVNVKHLVITGSDDDGVDWDQGWTGKAQFIIVQQLPGRGNHGFEADNNRAFQDAMPRSNPIIFNATLVGRAPDASDVGEGRSRGMVLRVGTAGSLNNLVVTNFNDWAMFVDGANSQARWADGSLAVRSSIFFKNPQAAWQNSAPGNLVDGGMLVDNFDEAMALQAPSLNNRQADPLLVSATTITAPVFKPLMSSPALTGGATPPSDGFFDTSATFVGAIGANDWTTGWTSYPEN
jgi:hypothetical protein